MTEGKEEIGEGRQEAGEVQVIVGSDSGGQCQASFRIHSLRSSCYIFYCRNKRMVCYFHMRAIFLRVASKRTRVKQECVREKQNLSIRNMKTTDMQLTCFLLTAVQVLILSLFRVKGHLRWIARRAVSNTSRQINT